MSFIPVPAAAETALFMGLPLRRILLRRSSQAGNGLLSVSLFLPDSRSWIVCTLQKFTSNTCKYRTIHTVSNLFQHFCSGAHLADRELCGTPLSCRTAPGGC